MVKNLLDIKCENNELFTKAITHPSYTQDKGLPISESYERLEFIGDAVLKLFSSQILYEKYPEYDEGKLSRIRSILVADSTIAQISFKIGLDKIIRFSQAEEKQNGRNKESNVACAFEAILGAYYLDGKIKEVQEFLTEILEEYIEDIDKNFSKINAKTTLQEYTQKMTKELPVYEVINVSRKAHKPTFEVRVLYENKVLAIATGSSKKEAQQNCAHQACIKLGILED